MLIVIICLVGHTSIWRSSWRGVKFISWRLCCSPSGISFKIPSGISFKIFRSVRLNFLRSAFEQKYIHMVKYFLHSVTVDYWLWNQSSLIFPFWLLNFQVAANGWSEGEYNGNAGWFPSAYVQRQDVVPANKIPE
jgi:hypothetical protein